MWSPHHPRLTLNPKDRSPEQESAAWLILSWGMHACWTLCWQEHPGELCWETASLGLLADS